MTRLPTTLDLFHSLLDEIDERDNFNAKKFTKIFKRLDEHEKSIIKLLQEQTNEQER